MGRRWVVPVVTVIWALPLLALAQQPMKASPACTAVNDAGLPAGWFGRHELAGATAAGEIGKAALPIGKGVDGRLSPTEAITYPVAPGRAGSPGSFGGLFEIRADATGDYKLSLGAPAWIELVAGGAALSPASHEPGPACSTLRKTVTYALKPGRYVLEVSGITTPSLPLMVSRVR